MGAVQLEALTAACQTHLPSQPVVWINTGKKCMLMLPSHTHMHAHSSMSRQDALPQWPAQP
eukprot:1157985-Pelagomonas_calceolata.AAC.7